MVSFYGWNRVDRFSLPGKMRDSALLVTWSSPKTHIEGRICGLSPRMRLHPGKSRPRLPQNPLPDVLGWKYSGIVITRRKSPLPACNRSLRASTPERDCAGPVCRQRLNLHRRLQSGRRYIGIELLEQYHRADSNDWPPCNGPCSRGPRMITV